MNKTTVGLLGFWVGALIACNGNNNPIIDPVDTTPPTLVSTLPLENALNVDLQSQISVAFSENLDASTLGSSVSLKQLNTNMPVSVSPSLNADTISIGHPTLSKRTTYQANVNGNLKDLAGNAFASTTWNFTTRDGVWNDAQKIDDPTLGGQSPRLVMAADGSAMAVWVAFPGTTTDVWANRYTPITGWGTPQRLLLPASKYRSSLQLVMDDLGNAIAIWNQSETVSGRADIVASRYTPSGGWSAPQAVETEDVRTAVGPVIAMNSSGSAVAAWAQNDGTRANVWANVFNPATGWGIPKLIETNDTGNANYPQVAIDSVGNAHVIWVQDAGSIKPSIWGNLYRFTGGWDVAFPLENETPGAANLSLGFNSSGNVMVVWDQIEETVISPNQTVGYWHAWVNMYTPSTGWGVAGRIPTLNNNSTYSGRTQIALDSQGNVLAMWLQNAGNQTKNDVWTNRYTFGQGWGTARALPPLQGYQNVYVVQVILDKTGNGLASLLDGGRWLYVRYFADIGWGDPLTIQPISGIGTSIYMPQVAADASGNYLGVFRLIDSHVWASEFK